LLAAAGAVGITTWAAVRVSRLEVTGQSMRPTLETGDRLLLVRSRRARPGDLVVVPDPRTTASADARRLVVKRVVVASSHGLTLRGDNAGASTDSRAFGPVPPSTVRGRVVYRYFPPHRRGRIRRGGRMYPEVT
jgi:nickel-type superoxide dismutase maturation protease